LPDAQEVSLEDLALQEPPFTVHIDHLELNKLVREFKGVIGQDGHLVGTGEFVELSLPHHEV